MAFDPVQLERARLAIDGIEQRPVEQRADAPPFLSERRQDETGNWTEHWHVWPPKRDERYRVTQQEWRNQYADRHIYAYERVPSLPPAPPPNDPDEVGGRRLRFRRK